MIDVSWIAPVSTGIATVLAVVLTGRWNRRIKAAEAEAARAAAEIAARAAPYDQLADRLRYQDERIDKLQGRIATNTSKNSAVALLAASLINRGVTVLKSVPKIEEVYRLLEVLTSLGVQATWSGSTLTIKPPPELALKKLDREAAIKNFLKAYKKATKYDGPVFPIAAINGEGTKPLIYAIQEALEQMARPEMPEDDEDENEDPTTEA